MAEIYSGPKFETVFLMHKPPEHHELHKLMHWCSVFHNEQLAPAHETGTAGNLSFRISPDRNAFCITGAGLNAKCHLKSSDFVIVEECDVENMKVYVNGTRFPSSESMMHFKIYETLPQVNAVFHGHYQEFLDQAGKIGLPVTEKVCDYGSQELIESIVPMLGQHNFFLIREHGFLSLGKSLDEAGGNALEKKNVCLF